MSEVFPDRGPSDPRSVFQVLADHEVDCVVIGGVAVVAHGHTRNTRDVDFVAATDRANLERLARALEALDAELWGVDAHLLGIELDADTLASGGNFTLQTKAGGLDFFNEVPGGIPYEELRERSILVEVSGIPIRIAGLDDLIRLKAAAGRPRDLADIAALTDPARREGP